MEIEERRPYRFPFGSLPGVVEHASSTCPMKNAVIRELGAPDTPRLESVLRESFWQLVLVTATMSPGILPLELREVVIPGKTAKTARPMKPSVVRVGLSHE